ncbi:hypothetical protein N7499_003336 [Penicillium canescens]|uniref:Uncharacterized protein n=1 Tax=Penicillium canescens TaxID=5083 RepID=A0AAD6IA65_PENCN|nr:uncharacterized protein N7446_012247 [Penicillium canescens]KAJ6020041.1 hypothetical protein N7522_000116 [Penicillium canescens]KAJ6037971.1 hypothetical protein N7460_007742 [Penicillium canescens]KAJ6045383.1 hypothetical protein N7446_012247 [Penicillium canescens]KAJ6061079.1 hypothetical protein N7444_001775 [Penicillium canescens]KAJ6090622.1 hypothetical protein N7499_003336 [Penicillium canescens]
MPPGVVSAEWAADRTIDGTNSSTAATTNLEPTHQSTSNILSGAREGNCWQTQEAPKKNLPDPGRTRERDNGTQAFENSDDSRKPLHREIQAKQAGTSRFHAVIAELRDELRRADKKHMEEIKHYDGALVGMQREQEAVIQIIARATTNTMESSYNGQYEEFLVELQALCTGDKNPINTKLGLPHVLLDFRSANDEIEAPDLADW